MGNYRIGVLPGDGTGREVALEAQRILNAIEANTNHGFEQTVIQCGGQHYLETGEEWAEGSFEFCKEEADAIYLGAIGYPGARLPNGEDRMHRHRHDDVKDAAADDKREHPWIW